MCLHVNPIEINFLNPLPSSVNAVLHPISLFYLVEYYKGCYFSFAYCQGSKSGGGWQLRLRRGTYFSPKLL